MLQIPRHDSLKPQGTAVNWSPSLDPTAPLWEGGGPALPVEAAAEPSFLPPELQRTAATQQPHASAIKMSVNNCHMLQYRLSKGHHPDLSPDASADVELVPTIPAAPMPSIPLSPPMSPMAQPGSKQKGGLLKSQLTHLSLKLPHANRVRPALVTVTPGKRMWGTYWTVAESMHATGRAQEVQCFAETAATVAELTKVSALSASITQGRACPHPTLSPLLASSPPPPHPFAVLTCMSTACMTTSTKLRFVT